MLREMNATLCCRELRYLLNNPSIAEFAKHEIGYPDGVADYVRRAGSEINAIKQILAKHPAECVVHECGGQIHIMWLRPTTKTLGQRIKAYFRLASINSK